MAVWSDLPTELVCEIVAWIEQRNDIDNHGEYQYDIHSLCAVSHHLHAVAKPYLYRNPRIEKLGPWIEPPPIRTSGYHWKEPDTDEEDEVCTRLRQFLRTVIMRPALGVYVTRLRVDCAETRVAAPAELVRLKKDINDDQAEELFAAFPAASKEDMLMLVAAAVENGFTNSDILQGGCAGQIVLLLDYLPNPLS